MMWWQLFGTCDAPSLGADSLLHCHNAVQKAGLGFFFHLEFQLRCKASYIPDGYINCVLLQLLCRLSKKPCATLFCSACIRLSSSEWMLILATVVCRTMKQYESCQMFRHSVNSGYITWRSCSGPHMCIECQSNCIVVFSQPTHSLAIDVTGQDSVWYDTARR